MLWNVKSRVSLNFLLYMFSLRKFVAVQCKRPKSRNTHKDGDKMGITKHLFGRSASTSVKGADTACVFVGQAYWPSSPVKVVPYRSLVSLLSCDLDATCKQMYSICVIVGNSCVFLCTSMLLYAICVLRYTTYLFKPACIHMCCLCESSLDLQSAFALCDGWMDVGGQQGSTCSKTEGVGKAHKDVSHWI